MKIWVRSLAGDWFLTGNLFVECELDGCVVAAYWGEDSQDYDTIADGFDTAEDAQAYLDGLMKGHPDV